ncbi:Kinesin-like protein [Pseudoloma neurophilia]|uniref:Kinesin-like protein n=1 Tax=Pseudoloma neurophilia TaxID=146866 RepID=A0A0R0M290_9MICR|nr:Kinesin-like protein [Pseudoloma neurophilia]
MSTPFTKRVHKNDTSQEDSYLNENLTIKDEPIKIYLRIRPTDHSNDYQLMNNSIQFENNSFTFHEILTEKSQEKVYKMIRPILNDTLSGYNSTIFTYGQTATGKTYTVTGTDTAPGIVPTILKWTENEVASMSVLEIYNEQLRDLLVENVTDDVEHDTSVINESFLSQDISFRAQDINLKTNENVSRNFQGKSDNLPLTIRETVENGIQVNNLKRISLQSYARSIEIYKKALTRRKKDQTQRNKESSRSHCILILWFKTRFGNKESRINVVDLAGSEKIGENDLQESQSQSTSHTGNLLNDLISSFHTKKKRNIKGKNLETGNINKSLLTLREVIKKLTSQNDHIPYRDSKLTFLLKDSLGGSSKLMVIGTVDFRHKIETMNTMMFLDMIKMIENKPVSVLKGQMSSEDIILYEKESGLDKRKPVCQKKIKFLKFLKELRKFIDELRNKLYELQMLILKRQIQNRTKIYEECDKKITEMVLGNREK